MATSTQKLGGLEVCPTPLKIFHNQMYEIAYEAIFRPKLATLTRRPLVDGFVNCSTFGCSSKSTIWITS